jgi:hypothetical protein
VNGLYPTVEEAKNRQTVAVNVTDVPTRVDVEATPPQAGRPKAVDVLYKGSKATDPNSLETVPRVEVCVEARHARPGAPTGGTPR